MAAEHHPKPDTLAIRNIDPTYRRMARQIAAEQGMTLGEYATRKFLDGLRSDLIAQGLAQEPAKPSLPNTLAE